MARPGDGLVMTDLTAIGKVNSNEDPSGCRSEYLDVSSFVIAGCAVTYIRRSHFTLMLPSHPGRNRRAG